MSKKELNISKTEYMQLCYEFEKRFKVPVYKFYNPLMTAITEKPFFDVIKFDEFLHKYYNYDENKHGSMKDFLLIHFNEEVAEMVSKFINL